MDGTLPAGLPLPSFKQLSMEYDVSASTARRAVVLLSEWGLVRVASGRRTVVLGRGKAGPPDPVVRESREVNERATEAGIAGRRLLEFELRRLGEVTSTFRAEADLDSVTDLQTLLAGAVRRSGGRPNELDDYELVVRDPDNHEAATTFVASPHTDQLPDTSRGQPARRVKQGRAKQSR